MKTKLTFTAAAVGACAALLCAMENLRAATLTVTNTADSGAGHTARRPCQRSQRRHQPN